MEILVAILIIAVIAAVIFAVMQRRSAGARGLGRPRTSPIGHRDRGVPRRDPMATAVAEHAQATDPQDVVAAEQRMRAQAHHVAAELHTEAQRSEHQRASDQVTRRESHAGDPRMDGDPDPAGANGYAETDRYVDPATDPRYDDRTYDGRPAADPRYDDRTYDGRPAADPRHDDPSR